MIVGIAGPSCSGKSTVAREVATATGALLLHLDGRWITGAEKPEVNGHRSYERPHQYDGASLLADIRAAADEGRVVVAEGFLLFAYPGIAEICHHRFYLDVAHDELVRRRLSRGAQGGNATWGAVGNDAVVDVGWLAHGREEWERFGAPQASLPGVVALDGHRPPRESAREIVEAITLRRVLVAHRS